MTTRRRPARTSGGAVHLLVIGALLLIVTGCATTPGREAIPPFRQGVVTADQQTSAAFADINSFLRRQQIERAVRQDALTPELFFEALPSADLSRWDKAFALIDSYAGKIEKLLDPDRRTGVEGELSALGGKIEALRRHELPDGVSVAFTKFGGLLVKLKAEQDALAAIRTADPGIQEVFSAMMEAIGSDSQSGVRGTVWTAWTQILARIDVKDFRPAAGIDAKRAVVLRYVAALDERDAQDRTLDSLRLSLTTLAKAHEELANGRRASAGALIQLIQDEYKVYREQLKTLREHREKTSASGGTT